MASSSRTKVTECTTSILRVINADLQALVKKRKFDNAIKLFNSLQKRSVEPDVCSYNALISCQNKNIEASLQCVDSMVKANLRPNYETINLLLCAYAQEKDVENAKVFFDEMSGARIIPDIACYNKMIDLEAKSNRQSFDNLVQSYLSSIDEQNLTATAVTYSSILNGFALRGDLSSALYYFEQMQRRGVRPSASCVTNVVKAYLSVNDVTNAQVFINRIQTYISKSDANSLHKLLNTYDSSKLTSEELNSRLKELVREGKRNKEALSLFDSSRRRDSASYNIMLSVLIRGKQYRQAELWLDRMKSDGVRPNVVTFNQLIDMHARSNDIHFQCERYLQQMQSLSIPPNQITHSTILHGFALRGDITSSLDYFNTIDKPSHACYTNVLRCYIKIEDFTGAEAFLERIKEDMGEVDIVSYGCLLDAYAHHGKSDHAASLFTKIRNPDIKCYTALIHCHSKLGNSSGALHYYNLMLKDSIQPDIYVFTSIIDCHAKSNDTVAAARWLLRCMKQGIQPNAHTFTTIVHCSTKSKDFNLATLFIKRLKHVKLSAACHNAILNLYAHQAASRLAVLQFGKLIDDGLTPTDASYNCVINAFKRGNDVSGAEQWLKRMQRDGHKPSHGSLGGLLQNLKSNQCEMQSDDDDDF